MNPANGARGGGQGGRAEQFVRRADGECETAEACAQVQLRSGETIVSVSCGGGGFGSPLERPPAQVAHDVREKWISMEVAETIYGVVIGPSGEADEAASVKYRAEMAGRTS